MIAKSMASLYVLGLGPGDATCLTPEAHAALASVQCIAGYRLYLDLIPEELKRGKNLLSSGMRQEEKRVSEAVDSAVSGTATALVCSGDPGIYALAGLCLEIIEAKGILGSLPLHILPGVPALCACAALLGAPLGHDFACISLSDLLTPWTKIIQRLECALAGDFVCVLYNPRSKGRSGHLAKALDLVRKYRAPDCPVGIVRNAYRRGQQTGLWRLDTFNPEQADMLSLVFIGSSESRVLGPYLLTPRGYTGKN